MIFVPGAGVCCDGVPLDSGADGLDWYPFWYGSSSKKIYVQSSLDTYISTLSQLQFLPYFKTFQCKQILTNKTI